MNTVSENTDNQVLLLQWDYLNCDEMQERIDWCRDNLISGQDWGFCAEHKICVIMNQTAAILYNLRWFEAGKTQPGYASGLFLDNMDTHLG